MALVGTVPGEISEAEFRKVISKPLIKVSRSRHGYPTYQQSHGVSSLAGAEGARKSREF